MVFALQLTLYVENGKTMTKILNIDELVQEAPIAIVIDGQKHEMKVPTLQDFILNMKDLEAMAAAPNIVAETEGTIRMIARAFPTLAEERIQSFPMQAIEKLFAIIREVDPEAKVSAEDESGNASSAT